MAQRILRGAAATLSFTNLDADGDPVDTLGTFTCAVTRADGTAVSTPAVTAAGAGVYTAPVTAAETASLDLLTATWTDSAATGSPQTTLHEIVGGYLFSIAAIRGFETLDDTGTYTTPQLVAARAEVEDELERLRRAAFVPRFKRIILDGTGNTEISTGIPWLRTLTTAKTLTQAGSATSTAFTAAHLAACVLSEDGRIRRGDGNVWTYGVANIVLEVEHGFTDWGTDLQQAALKRLRYVITRPDVTQRDRASSYIDPDGNRIEMILADENSTGIPEVDAVYSRYPRNAVGVQPSSKMLTYHPQSGGLFRGNRR